jgi:hypothetical protein
MKRIINIHIFVIATAISVFGQNINIQCDNNNSSSACFLAEPAPVESSYFANIDDGGRSSFNGWSKSNPVWTTPGDANAALIQTGTTAKVKWSNTPNTPIRKIKVKVVYSKGSETPVTIEVEKEVLVKHIGDILSVNVQNGNPSTVTVSGSTVILPCGNAPFTITTTPPFTSPTQTVFFNANLPAGWTGVSSPSSTNIGIITPNSTDGMITIFANRSDGTLIKEFKINFSRPAASQLGDPTINFTYGSPVTCNGQTRLMTGAAANATSLSWSPISTGTIFTPNAATGMIQFNSTTTLTLTANGCGQSKTVSEVIKVGPPTISPAVNNGPLQIPNYIQNPGFMALNPNQSGLTFNWEILNGTGNIYQSGYGQVYAYAYPFLRVQGTATNVCGSTSATFYLSNISSGYYRMVSSNPTQNTISVEMEKELGQLALVSVKLISHGRNSVERSFTDADARRTNHFDRSNKIDFDVSNLPRGTYYLLIDFKGEKKFKEIIVLN